MTILSDKWPCSVSMEPLDQRFPSHAGYQIKCEACAAPDVRADAGRGRSRHRTKVRMHIGHIVDKSLGGRDELNNLRSLCSACSEGAKNLTQQKPSMIRLLGQVRRAGLEEQRAVFDWLANKFRGG